MKFIYTLVLIAFATTAFGQQWPYKLTALSSPYSDIANGTSLNNGNDWTVDSVYKIPLTNFNFAVEGQSFDTIFVQSGRGVFFDLNYNHFLWGYYTVFGGHILADKGNQLSLSPISYQFTGQSGSQVLTIEFKNAGFDSFTTDTSAYLNYQIRLFEADNHLEIHYGPSLLNGVSPNLVPFVSFQCLGDTGFYVCSNPANPTTYWVNMNFPNYCALSSTPANGTLYKIEIDSLFSPVGIDENSFITSKVFPNPANDELTVFSNQFISFEKVTVSIFAIEGKEVMHLEKNIADENSFNLNISQLKKGIYFLQVNDGNKIFSQKVIKM